MAEINYTSAYPANLGVFTWSDVTDSDTFNEVQIDRAVPEVSVQITGTFGGATITVQGSNDGTNYTDLTTLGGDAASLTSAGIVSILERCRYYRLSASGGSSQSVAATMAVFYD